MVKTSDFKQKEVINLIDGKRLGFIYDVEINLKTGNVESIIIPSPGRFWNFFKSEDDYIIPWADIETVGDDVILVKYIHKENKRKNKA